MKHLTHFFTLFLFILFISPIFAEETPDWQLAADARIEKCRKTDVSLTVIRAGVPVSGAEVRLKMTNHEFLFGSNIFLLTSHDGFAPDAIDAEYGKKFAEMLNFATLPFYWWMYESEQGKPKHENREAAAAWCAEHGLVTKGHPLAWNTAANAWMKKLEPEVYHELQLARIKDCAARFQGKIDIWDVVNEVTQYDREECAKNGAIGTESMRRLGPAQAVREYFAAAREAAPDATLLINDYYVDKEYADLLDQLLDENGKPIFDVLGIQSHMHGGTWSNERIQEVCDRFSRFGVPLHFTELTILSGQPGWYLKDWESTPEGEDRQRDEVVRVYTMLFSQPAVKAVTWWDFADFGAWQGAPAGFLRKDFTPKPAYTALHDLIKKKWWTDETLAADASGNLTARVFRGTYEVIVTLPDGTEKTFEKTFTGEENTVALEVE